MTDLYRHTGGHGRSVQTYHTDPDCRVAPAEENQTPTDQDEIERRDLTECDVCAGRDATSPGESRDYNELIQNVREGMGIEAND